MNLLKKFKSLFQKSEGAEFKDPVKPGREKVKKNVGKEVFEKTGQFKQKPNSDKSAKSGLKSKERLAKNKTSQKSKSKDSEKSTTNSKTSARKAIKKGISRIKYKKKKVNMDLPKINKSGKAESKKPKSSRNKQ